ncbi:MAG TPA: MFS transporter, partial [Tepidisphaeraceae bacterium]|nr:MFS transporter [Tepidisphaeraceae bacterium]
MTETSRQDKHPRSPRPLVIVLAFIAFISLGLPDTILGVAWPSIRSTFALLLDQIGLLLTASMAGYLVSSSLGGQLVRTFGVGKLLVVSSLLVTLFLAGDSLAPAFFWMIPFAVIGGLGSGAIDAAINTFAALKFSPRIVNWLHAFWGVGATIGPLLITAALATHLGWRVGYAVLAAALALLSLFFLLTIRLWEIDSTSSSTSPQPTAAILEALGRPAVAIQVLLFLVYAGIESTAGQLLYTLLTDSRHIPLTIAGITVGAYWAALTLGRIFFGQLAVTISHRTVLRIGLGLAPFAAALIAWPPAPWVSSVGAVLLGFALAPIFPTLISDTPQRVGRYYAPQSVGFQVAAASLGFAAFPSLVGILARRLGLEVICAYLLTASLTLLALHEFALRLCPPPTHR